MKKSEFIAAYVALDLAGYRNTAREAYGLWKEGLQMRLMAFLANLDPKPRAVVDAAFDELRPEKKNKKKTTETLAPAGVS